MLEAKGFMSTIGLAIPLSDAGTTSLDSWSSFSSSCCGAFVELSFTSMFLFDF